MNQTIKRIVDLLFQDTVENEETNALHEELMNNCQEHYEDLVSRGMSEDEAIGAVVESLKGMKDVIDEYPKKESASDGNDEKTDDPNLRMVSFDACNVEKLRMELTSNEITVESAPVDRITVDCDEPEKIVVTCENGLLKIRCAASQNDLEHFGSFFTQPKNDDTLKSYISGILDKVRGALMKVADTIDTDINQPPVRVTVPESFGGELEIANKSGEIRVTGARWRRLSIHSISGGICAALPADHSVSCADINTTSGDIMLTLNTGRLQTNSISGDISADGVCGTAHLRTVSGDVRFRGDTEELETNTVSGDAEVMIENRMIRKIQANSVSGDLHIGLPRDIGSVHTELNTRSGDRTCRFGDAGQDAELKITVNSVSGDIRID